MVIWLVDYRLTWLCLIVVAQRQRCRLVPSVGVDYDGDLTWYEVWCGGAVSVPVVVMIIVCWLSIARLRNLTCRWLVVLSCWLDCFGDLVTCRCQCWCLDLSMLAKVMMIMQYRGAISYNVMVSEQCWYDLMIADIDPVGDNGYCDCCDVNDCSWWR